MIATDRPIPDIDESGKAISPEMIDALGRLAARDEEIARLNKMVADLTEMVISLTADKKALLHELHGPSSERHIGERKGGDAQGEFLFDTQEEADQHAAEVEANARKAKAAAEEKAKAKSEKAKNGEKENGGERCRGGPRHQNVNLERSKVELNPVLPPPPPGYKIVEIGQDTSWRMVYHPATAEIVEEVRKKYVYQKKTAAELAIDLVEDPNLANVIDGGDDVMDMELFDGVFQALASRHIVENGIPDETLLAHIAISKYLDCCPLYRQQKMLARIGADISRQSMANWMLSVGRALEPVAARMLELMLDRERLFADETIVEMLDPGKGKTKRCYFWVLAADDLLYGGDGPRMVFFKFELGRGGEYIENLLASYGGILQVDGYGVYETLAKERLGDFKEATKSILHYGDGMEDIGASEADLLIDLAFCWTHCRRYFVKSQDHVPTEVGERTLELMKKLWAVEEKIRGQKPLVRMAERIETSEPIVTELFDLWERTLPHISAKGKLAKAINYALERREGLQLFLHDGRVEFDSNLIERDIRNQSIIRKNSLFAGSARGGTAWGIITSLLETARLNDINPYAWLVQTLIRLAKRWPDSRVDELLPFNFVPDEAPLEASPGPVHAMKRIGGAESSVAAPGASPCHRAA